MKNIAKLVMISIFALGTLFMFLSSTSFSRTKGAAFSDPAARPTPPQTNSKPTNSPLAVATNTPAAAVPANTTVNANIVKPAETGGKTIKDTFTLAQDSEDDKYGEVAFNHKLHAFEKYSPDGRSVITCVECHHTDQPKSALKPPLLTSERDVAMTFDSWKASPQKVKQCRECHFQDTNIPEGKDNPTANYKDGDKSITKVLNNQLAYHINCNGCHDEALKKRPDLKGKKGFASGSPQDCGICHKLK